MRISQIACCVAALGILSAQTDGPVSFLRKSRYLNNRRAVVTHTLDDTNKFVLAALEAIDKYGLKATFFISTGREPITQLWPRLQQAVLDGHEIGAHSRTHRCSWPDTPRFCAEAYSESEIAGARDDILKNTSQPHVWA